MSCAQREQPAFRKESIGPAIMVQAASASAAALPPTQDATQTHTDPAVERGERRVVTVLEVAKPANQTAVELSDDRGQRVSIPTARMTADRGLEFLQALGARPLHATFKVIPEKIKAALLGGVHDACLFGMQLESSLRCPLLHHR